MHYKQSLNFSTCLLAGAVMLMALTSCKKDDSSNQQTGMYTLTATANGAQEVPAVTTSGTGTLTGTYDSNTNTLNYTLNWSGLSGPATLMHFHGPALAGTGAGVALGITGFTSAASGTFTGTSPLTDAQEADLLAGKWYWNIHTAAHGGGEIRGQVAVQ